MYREGHLRKQSIGAEMLLGRALAVNPCKVDRTGSCSLRCASTLVCTRWIPRLASSRELCDLPR